MATTPAQDRMIKLSIESMKQSMDCDLDCSHRMGSAVLDLVELGVDPGAIRQALDNM